jgi:hypothetical protein
MPRVYGGAAAGAAGAATAPRASGSRWPPAWRAPGGGGGKERGLRACAAHMRARASTDRPPWHARAWRAARARHRLPTRARAGPPPTTCARVVAAVRPNRTPRASERQRGASRPEKAGTRYTPPGQGGKRGGLSRARLRQRKEAGWRWRGSEGDGEAARAGGVATCACAAPRAVAGDPTCVRHRGRQRLRLGCAAQQPQVVSQPRHAQARHRHGAWSVRAGRKRGRGGWAGRERGQEGWAREARLLPP